MNFELIETPGIDELRPLVYLWTVYSDAGPPEYIYLSIFRYN